MKIDSIYINNFRSIKELTLPLKKYGSGLYESNATFLVGINESGKSAILDAINLINNGLSNLDYNQDCFLEAHDNDEWIDIYAYLDIEWEQNIDYWRKKIIEKTIFDEKFVSNLVIKKINKNTYKKKDKGYETFTISLNDDLPIYQYIINTTSKTINGKIVKTESIEILSQFNNIQEIITEKNANTFLKENQLLLTKSKLENYISSSLKSIFNENMPNIQIWKAKPEYLINDSIDLLKFKEDTNISIPLKNIFYIYGKTTDEDIKTTIEKSLENQARCDELQEKMSHAVSKYINQIWKEHKIKIRISINANICKVHVEDKDKKFAYYTMKQRSDGFKQFLSLILSLSVQNETNKLKNNIILIDEPEVHLHPSGIRYLRDEILKIAKNNIIILSTHSHYMVDTETPERHWIVQKEKSETKITQVSEDSSFTDDKVISTAFGLNLFKELLPKNIIIVEGGDDKNIISHLLTNLNNSIKFSIKAAGGASKAPGFARLLSDENIHALILLDSDKEGKDNKKSILDNQKEFYSNSNVFILTDILKTLPKDSTIEDILPINFVKSFFEKELNQPINLENDKSIISQLKRQFSLLNDKQKLDSLKMKLSIDFCKHFSSESELRESEIIMSFINNFVDLIEQQILK